MSEFIAALQDPSIPFLRYALLAGLLASVSFGIVGSYVVARRISALAGAIAHCVLGGIGAALYAQTVLGWTWCRPLYGATAAALIAAILLGIISLRARQREDAVINALWAVGMAIGLLFLAKTRGYVDPMSYLFGSILLVSKQDLILIGGLDILVAGLGLIFYNKLQAVCFDEEFARLRGIHVERHFLLLLCLTALAVVLLMTVVGIVMVIALLTLPAAAASLLARRMWQMMALAIGFCMTFTTTGLAFSYTYDLPSGPVIILIGAAVYLAVIIAVRLPARLHIRRNAPKNANSDT